VQHQSSKHGFDSYREACRESVRGLGCLGGSILPVREQGRHLRMEAAALYVSDTGAAVRSEQTHATSRSSLASHGYAG